MKNVRAYEKSGKLRKWLLYHLPCIVTLGLWFLLCQRYERLRIMCKYQPARSLQRTRVVLITDLNGNSHVSNVKRLRVLKEETFHPLDQDSSGSGSDGANGNDSRNLQQHSLYEEYVMFEYQQLRYVYDEYEQRFKVQHMDAYDLVARSRSTLDGVGLDSATHRHRLIQFGNNHIDIKPEKRWRRIAKTVFEPLHVFLLFVFVLLLIKQGRSFAYILYALLILAMNGFSMFLSYKQRSVSLRLLKDLAASYGREMRVIRDGESFMAGSASLVPGDVVEITGRITLPCDMVLIRGHVEVDESMITGDTVPAQKVPYSSTPVSQPEGSSESTVNDKRMSRILAQLQQSSSVPTATDQQEPIAFIEQENTLIGGSKTLNASYAPREHDVEDKRFEASDPNAALAVVIRTGFNSSKGKIIREVLNSLQSEKVHPYIRDTETFIRLIIIGGIVCAALSLICTVVQLWSQPSKLLIGFVDALDFLLCIAPPFLPIMVNWPVRIANKRLKHAKIQATSLKSLLQFGIVDCVCYDKTGTLTDNTLGFYGVLETIERTNFSSNAGVVSQISFAGNVHRSAMEISEPVFNLMACCHNLTKINNDKISGDRLEEALFAETNYELKRDTSSTSVHHSQQQQDAIEATHRFIVHPPPELNERGVIQVTHIFPFNSELRRMSVVTRYPTFCIYSKGSPKSIQTICRPETLPQDFDKQIQKFGLLGFRIIAIARRELPTDDFFRAMERHEAETDMQFLGFIIMKNKLHKETIPELKKLAAVNIRSSGTQSNRSWGSRFLHAGSDDEEDEDLETISLRSSSSSKSLSSGIYISASDDHRRWDGSMGHDEDSLMDEDDSSQHYYKMRSEPFSKSINVGDNDLLGNRIRTLMITGDTAYTAISVARECGMIDSRRRILLAEVDDGHLGEKMPQVVWRQIAEPSNGDFSDTNTELVVTGYAFSLLRNHRRRIGDMHLTSPRVSSRSDSLSTNTIITDHGLQQYLLYNKLLVRANIFTEMLPLQKAELISDLKALDYTVAMCGDGSNDSMALTAADVSLSISEAETSYAAQFTSTENRHCMSFMIGDSRALLDKILHNFKFLAVFVAIQVLYMSHYNLHLPNQFQLAWSGFINGSVIVFCNAFSSSAKRIKPNRPPLRLMRLPLLLSVVVQVVVQFFFFMLVYFILISADWYEELRMISPDEQLLHDLHTSFLFIFSNFQHLAVAFAFNFNSQFTRPWRNILLIVSMVSLFLFNLLVLWPLPPMPNTYNGIRVGGINTSGIKLHFPNAVWVPFGMMREPADYTFAYAYWITRVSVGLSLAICNILVSWLCEFLLQKCVALWKDKSRQRLSSNLLYKRLTSLIMKRRRRMS